MSGIKPLMRYHGAKWRLAPWIISHFPPHECYVEVFGGSGAVLISKPVVANEVFNDISSDITTLFRVMRDPDMLGELIKVVNMTPYSRDEFLNAYKHSDCDIETARRVLVRANMGFGSGGAARQITGFRHYTNRPGKSLPAHWKETADKIRVVAERISNAIIENRGALDVIRDHAREGVLFYLDPPYLRETRNVNRDSYEHEMSLEEHVELLELIAELASQDKGDFIVSGYDSDLYNDFFAENGWTKSTKQVAASSQKGASVRTECLWTSPSCQAGQLDMFSTAD